MCKGQLRNTNKVFKKRKELKYSEKWLFYRFNRAAIFNNLGVAYSVIEEK